MDTEQEKAIVDHEFNALNLLLQADALRHAKKLRDQECHFAKQKGIALDMESGADLFPPPLPISLNGGDRQMLPTTTTTFLTYQSTAAIPNCVVPIKAIYDLFLYDGNQQKKIGA